MTGDRRPDGEMEPMLAIDHITEFGSLVKRLQDNGIDCIHCDDFTVRLREYRSDLGPHGPYWIEHDRSDWGWHLCPEFPVEPDRALGPLSYSTLRDILLSLSELTAENSTAVAAALTRLSYSPNREHQQIAVLAALSRLAVSPQSEQRRLAQGHPLYPKVEETLRVQSALMGPPR